MRFKEFLVREEGVAARHLSAAKMTFDEMVDWVRHNAMGFAESAEYPIWRGIQSNNAEGLYNGAQLKRKAANTHNYANLWMSEHDDWSAYPPRDKSFICSTGGDYVESYGAPYVVVPSDSSKIGICPEQDLWDSFDDMGEATDHFGMDELMGIVHSLITRFTAAKNADTDWDALRWALNSLDIEDVKKLMGEKGVVGDMATSLFTYMDNKDLETLYEFFEYMFDPKKNGFEVKKAESFQTHQDREVWMTGSVLMVTETTWNKIRDELGLD